MNHVRSVMGVIMVGLLVASACGNDTQAGSVATPEPTGGSAATSVIVDYSPTVSDVAALLYLTQHPAVELLGVTLVGTGESHCEAGVSNTVALLELADVAGRPVACGPEQPVGPGHEWPPDWREASDALAGLSLPAGSGAPVGDAVDLLAGLAAGSSEPITIVALGPLTNLATAIERHPTFVQDVAMIYTMGGAFDVDGNAPGGLAEWNYFIDPTSVDRVLASGIPVTMIPLDATNHVPVTQVWHQALSAHHTTAAADAVLDLHTEARPFDFGFYFWDELAAAVALDESLVTVEERSVTIETSGERAGQTMSDPAGVDIRVAVGADRARFETELLTGLNAGTASTAPISDRGAPDSVTASYVQTLAESVEALDAGVEQLFTSPEAVAFDAVVGDDPAPVLSPGEEEIARAFLRAFWVGATDLMQDHRNTLTAADVPGNLTEHHAALLSAVDAVIGARDERLETIDDLSGEPLVSFLWAPTPELESFDSACTGLQAALHADGITVQVCPG